MHKKIITILNSPLGYKYKCVFIYNYLVNPDNKLNGTFYIGNPKTTIDEACITISVYYPQDENRFADSSIASLILVKYYEKCAENRELKQGEGTVDMMNTSMSFVKQICNFVKEFKLNDASTKKCENGSIISLPYFYITQKGQTWYEGRFNAYLKEPYYTAYKNTINKIMNIHLPQFEVFKLMYIKNTSDTIINELKSVYNDGDKLKIFFNKLYEKYDKSMGCIILQPWIDNLMAVAGLQTYIALSDWYIEADKIATYSFKRNTNNIYKVNNYNNTRKKHPWVN